MTVSSWRSSLRHALAADALVRHVVTFGRVLREVGIEAGPGRISDALAGLDRVELASADDVYYTLRQTLVARHDELELFDRAFAAWFLRAPVRPPGRALPPPPRSRQQLARPSNEAAPSAPEHDGEGSRHELGSSPHELLREKDFAAMTPDEFDRARALIAQIAATRPLRRSRRLRAHPRGDRLDLRRLMRESLATASKEGVPGAAASTANARSDSMSSCASRTASERWRATSAFRRRWVWMRAIASMPSASTRKAISASISVMPRWRRRGRVVMVDILRNRASCR